MRKQYQHPAPRLSFFNAMSRTLELPDGTTVSVRTCSEAVFVAMLTQMLHRHIDEEAITLEICGLCYENAVDKWYALNILLKHGIAV
jgi:hypothetical protein